MSFHSSFRLIMMLKIDSLSIMPNIPPFQMLSTAVFSHIITMHSFHNGLEARGQTFQIVQYACQIYKITTIINSDIKYVIYHARHITWGLFDDNINWIPVFFFVWRIIMCHHTESVICWKNSSLS